MAKFSKVFSLARGEQDRNWSGLWGLLRSLGIIVTTEGLRRALTPRRVLWEGGLAEGSRVGHWI